MTVRTLGPEPSASTNSATRAKCFYMIMKIPTLVNTAGADFLGFPRTTFAIRILRPGLAHRQLYSAIIRPARTITATK